MQPFSKYITKTGYSIDMVHLDSLGKMISQSTFIDGWLSKNKRDVWGRPVDIAINNDGSMLISDDFANCIYRVWYEN